MVAGVHLEGTQVACLSVGLRICRPALLQYSRRHINSTVMMVMVWWRVTLTGCAKESLLALPAPALCTPRMLRLF